MTRFEEKYRVDPSGCWLWTAGIHKFGYGLCWNGKTKRVEKAHRMSYERYVGQITEGKFVLHKCDVRHCVNPDHLFLGTQQDNVADMVNKGRQSGPAGSANHGAKLKPEQVRDIRKDSREPRFIAAEYGIHVSHVWRIRTQKKWSEL